MPIHNSLVSALSSVAGSLFASIREVEDILKSLREVGVFELRSSPTNPPVVASADSSWALKSYSMVLVYAVQYASIRVSPGKSTAERQVVDADAGYLIPSRRTGDATADEVMRRAVEFISRRLEVSALAEVSEGADVALFDGSLFTFLWYSKFPKIPRGLKSFKGVPSKFRDIWREVARHIESIVASGASPLFISKSVRRSYYVDRLLAPDSLEKLGGKVNDLMLIELMRKTGRLPRGALMLEPVHISSFEEMPRPLDSLDPDDRPYLEPLMPITATYVVFSPTAQAYQITVPGKWSPEDLAGVLSDLYPYSHAGYPEPLRVVHHLIKISSPELRYLLLKLGLAYMPTGREPLGEVA